MKVQKEKIDPRIDLTPSAFSRVPSTLAWSKIYSARRANILEYRQSLYYRNIRIRCHDVNGFIITYTKDCEIIVAAICFKTYRGVFIK